MSKVRGNTNDGTLRVLAEGKPISGADRSIDRSEKSGGR